MGCMQVGQFEGEVEQWEQFVGEDQVVVYYVEDYWVGFVEIVVDCFGDVIDGCFDFVVVEQVVGFCYDLVDVCEIDGYGVFFWLG